MFLPIGTTRRNQANNVATAPVAVADGEKPQRGAEAKQNESVLLSRMVRIIDQDGVLVCEYRLGLLEWNAVLTDVGTAFRGSHSKRRTTTKSLVL